MSADQKLCHMTTLVGYWHLSDNHNISNGVLCYHGRSCTFLRNMPFLDSAQLFIGHISPGRPYSFGDHMSHL